MDQNERNRIDQLIDFSSGFKQLKCSICGLNRKSFRSDDRRAIRNHILKCELASRRNRMILPRQHEASIIVEDIDSASVDDAAFNSEVESFNGSRILYTCRFENCGKAMTTAFNLKRHERIHSQPANSLSYRHGLIDEENKIYFVRQMLRSHDSKVIVDLVNMTCTGLNCLNLVHSNNRVVCEHITSIKLGERNDLPIEIIGLSEMDLENPGKHFSTDAVNAVVELMQLAREDNKPLIVESSENPATSRHLSVFARNSSRVYVKVTKDGWSCNACSSIDGSMECQHILTAQFACFKTKNAHQNIVESLEWQILYTK